MFGFEGLGFEIWEVGGDGLGELMVIHNVKIEVRIFSAVCWGLPWLGQSWRRRPGSELVSMTLHSFRFRTEISESSEPSDFIIMSMPQISKPIVLATVSARLIREG